MEEFYSWVWSAVGVVVPVAFVGALAIGVLRVLMGNEQQKSIGWKGIAVVLGLIAFGVGVSMFFPQVGQKMGKTIGDPCQLIGGSCK